MPKYILTENGNIKANEQGNPIIENEDGTQYGLDAISLTGKIHEVNKESKDRKEKIRELTTSLEKFSKIDDPAKALEALETMKNLSEKDLKNKEDLELLKTDMENAWKVKMEDKENSFKTALTDKDSSISTLQSDLHAALVQTQFASSPLFAGEDRTTTLTPDIAYTYFGNSWKIETNEFGERVSIGYANGKPIYSQINPGDIASFEEAMPKIIEASGQKIMKESTGSGSRSGKGSFRSGSIDASDNAAMIRNLDKVASGEVKAKMN